MIKTKETQVKWAAVEYVDLQNAVLINFVE